MKKEFFALATVLVFMVCMTGVTAIDSWGMDSHFINGDKYVYNATVAIVNDTLHYYHYDCVVYENATVVTTTSNVVKVIVDGQVIPSPNGLPYRFSPAGMHVSKPHYTNMPVLGKKKDKPVTPVIDHSKEYGKIGDVMNTFINSFGKSGNALTFRDLPYTEVRVGNMTFRLTKLIEPISEVLDTVPYNAVYEDDGGYYRVTIESTHPFLGLKQSEKTIRYINIGGVYCLKNFEFYQQYLTDNDEFNKTYISTMPYGGKYTLIDGKKMNYQEYQGSVEYCVERTAPKPSFAKEPVDEPVED